MIDDVARARTHERAQFGPELGGKAGEFYLHCRLRECAKAQAAIFFRQRQAEIAIVDQRLSHDRRDFAGGLKFRFIREQVAHDGAGDVAKFLDVVGQFKVHLVPPSYPNPWGGRARLSLMVLPLR